MLREELDREKVDHDMVYIRAYDRGVPERTGNLAIEINIMDANDNDPKFENATYEKTVNENIPVGTTILRVRARDSDAGNNGRVVYQFSKHTQLEHGELFGIDEDSGEIFVRGILDFEEGNIYLLSLIAHDKGPDSLPNHATAIIRVLDMNDNAPEISVNTLNARGNNGEAVVSENAKLETFVAHISVMDADQGRNGKYTCSIDDENFELQKLYLGEFKIVTAAVFDREERDMYEVSLTCRDRGSPPQISIADVSVHVGDENDHSPVFARESYSLILQENNEVDALILQVNATDRDTGPNGRITYRLDERGQKLVTIDPEVGLMRAKVIFDYEEARHLHFDVIAEDNGSPPRSSHAPIDINLLDLNDEMPEFDKDEYNFGVFENQDPGTKVGTVVAYDRDSDPNNKFRYYLDLTSDSHQFRIDAKTGDIFTEKTFDREKQKHHFLVAVVTPLDDPNYTNKARVNVYVADKNDNPPVFDFPSSINHSVEVSSKAPVGYQVTRLRARDPDEHDGPNARLTFSLVAGNEDEDFILNPATGAISINAHFAEQETKRVYHFQVRVQDSGEPQLEDSSSLDITVNPRLPFALTGRRSFLSGENLTIVLAFALATIFVAIIIIIAIVIIIRRGKQPRNTPPGATAKEKQCMLAAAGEDNHVPDGKATPNTYVTIDKVGSPEVQRPPARHPQANSYGTLPKVMHGNGSVQYSKLPKEVRNSTCVYSRSRSKFENWTHDIH